ncbi:hypothetical protein XENTR_v10008223 [Xenopus tropicalis]|nr:hypothetical protein XENTR_v10008223 [Xenopus tropicalis]
MQVRAIGKIFTTTTIQLFAESIIPVIQYNISHGEIKLIVGVYLPQTICLKLINTCHSDRVSKSMTAVHRGPHLLKCSCQCRKM